MRKFPQSILQLYSEILDLEYPDEDIIAVQHAYELQRRLFSALYTGSGKSHIEHGVGTAGILVSVGAPVHLIQAAFVHNAYGLADFGDGYRQAVTARRRSELRAAIGERAEECVRTFGEMSWNAKSVTQMLDAFDRLDANTRETLLLRLADHLEHHLDGGFLYRNSDYMLELSKSLRPHLHELANRLGFPRFGDYFDNAYAEIDARQIPSYLQSNNIRRFYAPRSYSMRLKVIFIRRVAKLRYRVKKILHKIAARFGVGAGERMTTAG